MSVLIKWWGGVKLQSCLKHKETGRPGGGRDWWKKRLTNKIKEIVQHFEVYSCTI